MDQDLKQFARQWLAVAAGTALVVVVVAFLSMPLTLGFHPGEAVDRLAEGSMHMS